MKQRRLKKSPLFLQMQSSDGVQAHSIPSNASARSA